MQKPVVRFLLVKPVNTNMHSETDYKSACVPMYLGITGHQDMREEDKTRLKQIIKEIIEEKKIQCPHTPIVILTPLAEGADRLAAYAAMECGISFVASIPMPVDEYRRDFSTRESLDEFNELYRKADYCYELPLPQGTTVKELRQNHEKRDDQYYQNGLFVARQSEMLIALWDGTDTVKRGGTAHIVKSRRQGLPSSHPLFKQRLQNLQSGPICHIVTPRKSSPPPAEAFSKKMIYSDYWSSEEYRPLEDDRQVSNRVDAYNRDVLMLGPTLLGKIKQSEGNLEPDDSRYQISPELKRIAHFYAVTDSLASHFKRKRFFAFKMLLMLAVIASIFFMIYMVLWPEPAILILYPLAIGMGSLGLLHANRMRYRQKHDDYRALSEAFRIQYFLFLAQRKINISEYYLQKHKGELEWRIYALRAALLKSRTGETTNHSGTDESILSDCRHIQDFWVSSQLDYYRKSSLKYLHFDERFKNAGYILLIASLALALLLFLLLTGYIHLSPFLEQHEKLLQSLLVICTPGLLIISGVVFGYKQKMAFGKQSGTFQQMYQLFRFAHEKLKAAIASKNHHEAVEIIRELAHESLMENLEAHQHELQVINTLYEEQKEELFHQKLELQATLENLHKTQTQLIESEKMAALGGLVAGVAHEINTPVGIGITAISTLLDDVDKMARLFTSEAISRDDFRQFLQSAVDTGTLIQKNLERTASIIQSFKQVSVDQISEQRRTFLFRDYLNDIVSSLQPKFKNKDIRFKIVCDDELELNSYPGVYAQIFTNLLLNSLQHGFAGMKEGIIGIEADLNNERLRILYQDNGSGISKKDLPHIFEPFYTSDQCKGTGLGLHIIYNQIRQKLNGTITCKSEQGEGAIFMIEVPVND